MRAFSRRLTIAVRSDFTSGARHSSVVVAAIESPSDVTGTDVIEAGDVTANVNVAGEKLESRVDIDMPS